jgi:hypothetical protein
MELTGMMIRRAHVVELELEALSTLDRSEANSIAMQKTNEADRKDLIECCMASKVRLIGEKLRILIGVQSKRIIMSAKECVCCEHL